MFGLVALEKKKKHKGICLMPLLVNMKLLTLLSVFIVCFYVLTDGFWMKDDRVVSES